jgi:uncharacterized caspase-like protein
VGVGTTVDPVTGLEVWVNGRHVTPASLRGFIPVGSAHSRTITVPLGNGENRIVVRATNAVGTTERELTLFATRSGSSDRKGRLFLVAIGVDRYPHVPRDMCLAPRGTCDLNYAGIDARSFHDEMVRAARSLHSEVITALLINGSHSPNGEPTAANIADVFDLLRPASDADTVIVFLSGHGVNDNVHGRKRYLFLPTNASRRPEGTWQSSSVFSWASLEEALAKAGGNRLLLVDTCHAANSYSGQIVKNAHDDRIAVITATDRDTPAYELASLGNGVFTHAVLRALRGEAARNGEIYLYEFAAVVARLMRELTNEAQQPVVYLQGVRDHVIARVE